jgi:hypothetical protein
MDAMARGRGAGKRGGDADLAPIIGAGEGRPS